MPTLSACLIAKNESLTIGNCLKSLQPVASEVIVVDTGSTDSTVDIARSYSAKVVTTSWENDFSKARNLALSYATQDWILIIDCDEIIPDSQVPFFKAFLAQDTPLHAFQFKVHNLVGGHITSSAIILRLFRNHQGFKFTGKMHEQVSPSIVDTYGPGCIGVLDCYLEHFGYDNDVSSQKQKSDRNLSLLLSYDEKDKDGYYYYVLGNEYSRLVQLEAAAKYYELSLQHTDYTVRQDIYYAYVLINLASIYYALGRYDQSLALCLKGETVLPNFKDLYMTTALSYYAIGNLSLTKTYANKYIHCTNPLPHYPEHQYDYVDAPRFIESFDTLVRSPFTYSALLINEETPTLFEMVKNLNNISYKVFAFISEDMSGSLLETRTRLTRLGVQLITLPSLDNFLASIADEVKGHWLLTLHGDEFIPLSAINLLEYLTFSTDCTHYNLTILDQLTGSHSSEVRLTKVDADTSSNPFPEESCIIAFKHYTL